MARHLFFMLLLPLSIFADEPIAEVVLVKGQVTKLYPGTTEALKVKKGDKLPEDTSLATGERSIVKVKYIDGSQVTVGPKGHVNLVMASKKGEGLISLLKGKIRSQVLKKDKSAKTKMIIKTRTAALGVRGTDFQTVYNPNNKNTSLVTFEGEVAMKKVDEKEIIKKSIEAKTSSAATTQSVVQAPVQNFNDYDKIIEKDSVVVKKGRFSGVSEKAAEATNPVKINPKQYVAMKKSQEFTASETPIKVTQQEVEQAAQEINQIADAPKVAQVTAAPKPGGFVDMNTAMYVAPTQNAVFNKKLGVFEDESIGSIAEGSSEYVPPEGLKLDEEKGFVVDESLDKKQKKEAEEKIVALNSSLVGKQEPGKIAESKARPKAPSEPAWYSPKKHIFTFRLAASGQDIGVKPSDSQEEFTFDSSEGFVLGVKWEQKWSDKWSSFIHLKIESYDYDTANYNHDSSVGTTFNKDTLYNRRNEGSDNKQFRIGAMYYFRPSLKFFSFINFGSVNYVDAQKHNTSNPDEVELYVSDKSNDAFGLGINWLFLEYQTWSFGTEFIFKKLFSTSQPYCESCPEGASTTEFKGGAGVELALAAFYKLSPNKKLYLEFRGKNDTFEIERPSNSFTQTIQVVESTTGSGEIALNYLWEI